MSVLKLFFKEKCPKCGSILDTKADSGSRSITIKTCPNMHYQKEFHPALETYIECDKVS